MPQERQETKATDILRGEHRIIESVLDALEAFSADPQAVSPAIWKTAVDFLESFADGLHHAKEEEVLFPFLVERGLPDREGPVRCMLADHQSGREHVRAMKSALELLATDRAGALAALGREARLYVELLRFHIRKEDTILFPFADSMLTPEDHRKMAGAFDAAERARIGRHSRGWYLHIARQLESVTASIPVSYGSSRPAAPCPGR